MTSLTLDKAYLIGAWLESLFYGINVVLFCASLYILLRGRNRAEVEKTFLAVFVSQFLLSTGSVALGMRMIVVGFIQNGGIPGATLKYMEDFSNPLRRAKIVTISVNSVFSNSILVWRVYRVWSRNWRVAAFPVLLVIGAAACTVGQTIEISRDRPFNNGYYSGNLERWNISLYVILLATNVIGTGLVVFGIWSMLPFSSFAPAMYRHLLTLVIESGMVYSFALTLGIILYVTGHNSFFLILEVFGQLSSIIPAMILSLVRLKSTTTDKWSVTPSRSESSQHHRSEVTSTLTSPVVVVGKHKYAAGVEPQLSTYGSRYDVHSVDMV